MKNNYRFRARIASNRFSSAFDTSYSSVSTASAMSNLKRKNPAWKDCYVWAEILEDNGDWIKL